MTIDVLIIECDGTQHLERREVAENYYGAKEEPSAEQGTNQDTKAQSTEPTA